MIQPLTATEINSVRAFLANGVQKQKPVSWGDIRYMKKAAGNLLRETGGITTSYTGSRVEFDSNGIRLYNASDVITVNLDALTGNGTFTGTVTATLGTIGGWTIGTTSLLSGTRANTRAIDSGGTNPAFYAGSATPGSAPFRVSAAGALVATDANITGAINATSGSFSGSLSGATGTFAGSLSAATGTFSGSLSAASGTFAGSLSAATGTFSGDISGASGTFTGSLSGATITGGTVRTAASGTRVQLTGGGGLDVYYGSTLHGGVAANVGGLLVDSPGVVTNSGLLGVTLSASNSISTGLIKIGAAGNEIGFFGETPVGQTSRADLSGSDSTTAQLHAKVNAMIGDIRALGFYS